MAKLWKLWHDVVHKIMSGTTNGIKSLKALDMSIQASLGATNEKLQIEAIVQDVHASDMCNSLWRRS